MQQNTYLIILLYRKTSKLNVCRYKISLLKNLISKNNLSESRQIFTYFNELLESDELLVKILSYIDRK